MSADTILIIVGVLALLCLAYNLGYGNGYSQAKWEEFNNQPKENHP